jgi:hypothetical protein
VNSFLFVRNAPIGTVDPLGLKAKLPVKPKLRPQKPPDWNSPDPPDWDCMEPECKQLSKAAYKNLLNCNSDGDPLDNCADICGCLTSASGGNINESICIEGCMKATNKRCP